MLKKEYYCLVSGLPDLFFNEDKVAYSSHDFRNELQHQLSLSDYKLVEYLFLPFDNQNLLNFIFERPTLNSCPGVFTSKELEAQLSPENEIIQLPSYMLEFLKWVKKQEMKKYSIEAENILYSLYFEYAIKCKNNFLINWLKFELNTKNILTAFSCKKHNYPAAKQLVATKQETQIYSLLINDKLKPELFEDDVPFHNQLFKLANAQMSMIDREKALDKIKWDYLDEHTYFHYFTIEKILSYVIKLQTIERWMKLDTKTGQQFLNNMIDELKTSYKFPPEFSLNK